MDVAGNFSGERDLAEREYQARVTYPGSFGPHGLDVAGDTEKDEDDE